MHSSSYFTGGVFFAGAFISALLLLGGCCAPVGPTAAFIGTPRTGDAPLDVQFSDQSTPGDASITAWAWDFGDGASSPFQHPDHTYLNAGSYAVSLTVTTANGSNSYEEADYIVVTEPSEEGEGEGAAEGEGQAEGEVTAFVEVPDPLAADNPRYTLGSANAPAAGQSVGDADFGLSQRRVTQTAGLRHEYSRHDPFNSDQSMILLLDIQEGQWLVYRTASVPYDTAGQLVAAINFEEPRWDPADPNILWGSTEFRVVKVDVRQPENVMLVKDFAAEPQVQTVLAANPDLYRITMKDEGESSVDKRYWAFIIQGSNDDYRARYLFTWDRQSDQILGFYTVGLAESDIDWIGMSPLGTWVLIGGMDTNTGNLTGLTMADKAFTQFHRIDFSTAHADVALDSAGQEVVVMQNVRTDYIDLIPLDFATQPILENGGSYAGTNRVPLVRLYSSSGDPIGLNSGVHISCNTPGYAVVSTSIEPGLAAQNWLDRKIILVKLDRANPRAFYLAKVYGTDGAYWEETQAAITADGMKVIWATNWNQNVGQERIWDMQLDLPPHWKQDLGQ